MPLVSELFRDSSKLQACLLHDPAHVTPGAVGDHVARIQFALAELDEARIAENELAAQAYGPSTAAAVLSYKSKRNIINRSYQTNPDNIVGKMTIASLDKEIAAREQHPSPCDLCLMNHRGGDIEPAGAKAASGPSLNFAFAAAPVAPIAQVIPPPAPREMALLAAPLALTWTQGALSEIELMLVLKDIAELQKNKTLAFSSFFSTINTHFHLDRDRAHLRRNLLRLKSVFELIKTTISQGSTFFRNGPLNPKSPFADAPMGGFQFPGTQFNRITFRPGFVTCGPNTRAAMLIHEAAHFVGGLNVISHFAMEFPAPQGAPQGKGHTRDYQQLLTSEALRNASSYAAYAIHATTLTDSRFGASNIAL